MTIPAVDDNGNLKSQVPKSPFGPRIFSRKKIKFVGSTIIFLLLVLGGIFAWRWYQYWLEEREFREGMALAEENDFDAALPFLIQFHERHPEDARAVRALALGYLLNTRQLAETRKYLDRWCELEPEDPEPYRRRLGFWLMQEMVTPSIADAEHILRIAPNDFETRRKLVELLQTDGRYEQAEKEGLRCFQKNPKDKEMWFILANVYHGLGNAAKSRDLADQLLRVAPDHLGALKLRAKLYVEAGQPEKAIRLLKDHVVGKATSPDGTEGLYELSEALLRAGRADEAKQVLAELEWREALGLWSKYEYRDDNPGLQERVVEAMLAADKTDDAIRFLKDILKRNPNAPPGTHQLLDRCYEKRRQEAKEKGKPEEGVGK